MPRAPYHLDAIKANLARNGEMRAAALARACDIGEGTLLAGVKTALRDGVLVRRAEGRNVFYSLGEGVEVEPAVEPGDFNAALWADGELVLVGVKLNTDGESVTLSASQTRTLCQLLNGQGPA